MQFLAPGAETQESFEIMESGDEPSRQRHHRDRHDQDDDRLQQASCQPPR